MYTLLFQSKELEKNVNKDIVRVIVGNKSDLESQREVTFEEGKKLAGSKNARFIGNYDYIQKHLPRVPQMWMKHLLLWQMKLLLKLANGKTSDSIIMSIDVINLNVKRI